MLCPQSQWKSYLPCGVLNWSSSKPSSSLLHNNVAKAVCIDSGINIDWYGSCSICCPQLLFTRAAMKTKLITSYFYNQLISLINIKENIIRIKYKVKILWLQLLKCGYFLVFFFCDSKLDVFGLWPKTDIWGQHLGLWETLIKIFPHFLPFTDQTANWKKKLAVKIIVAALAYTEWKPFGRSRTAVSTNLQPPVRSIAPELSAIMFTPILITCEWYHAAAEQAQTIIHTSEWAVKKLARQFIASNQFSWSLHPDWIASHVLFVKAQHCCYIWWYVMQQI